MDASPTAGRSPPAVKDRDRVEGLVRGLLVMKAFDARHPRLTLGEAARLVGLSRAAVRRALLTLQSLGYVNSDGRHFSLSPQVLTLAQAWLSSSPVPRVAQGFLEKLSETLGQSCSLSILHDDEVIYIARSTRKRIGSLHRDVGAHLPAHCTSMGRVLLAALPEGERDALLARAVLNPYTPYTTTGREALRAILERVLRQGYSLVDQELEVGLKSIAVPVANASGRVIAAMNVSDQGGKLTKREMVESYLPVLRDTAAKMRPLLIG
jgi:IclR family transcriptional regulator, pca regulon regulatory protein